MTNENKQENVEQFLRVTKELLKAKHYLSLTTGEAVDIDLTSKSIYSWMKDRWTYFTKGNGQYYDSQTDVADALGIHRNTVGKIIAKFLEHGIFVVEKRKNGRFENSVYAQIKPLTFVDVPKAPKKGPKSVSPITLYPYQGLEEIVESEALVERYSEPVEVAEELVEEVMEENHCEEESEVVFADETVSVVRMEKYNNKYTYGQDYFPDYPKSPYDQYGKVSDEFKAWLMKLGGELTCDTYFEFEGDFYRIPRCSL